MSATVYVNVGLLKVLAGETYLFGGRSEISNLALATKICVELDARLPRSDGKSYSKQIAYVTDRPGHDFRYAVNPSFAETALNCSVTTALDVGLGRTIDWFLANREMLSHVERLGKRGIELLR